MRGAHQQAGKDTDELQYTFPTAPLTYCAQSEPANTHPQVDDASRHAAARASTSAYGRRENMTKVLQSEAPKLWRNGFVHEAVDHSAEHKLQNTNQQNLVVWRPRVERKVGEAAKTTVLSNRHSDDEEDEDEDEDEDKDSEYRANLVATADHVSEVLVYELMRLAAQRAADALRRDEDSDDTGNRSSDRSTHFRAAAAVAQMRQLLPHALLKVVLGDRGQWYDADKNGLDLTDPGKPKRRYDVTRPTASPADPNVATNTRQLRYAVDPGIVSISGDGQQESVFDHDQTFRETANAYLQRVADSSRGAEWMLDLRPKAAEKLSAEAQKQLPRLASIDSSMWTLDDARRFAPKNIATTLLTGVAALRQMDQVRRDQDYLNRLNEQHTAEAAAFRRSIDIEDASKERRSAVWSDALREVAISGDRLYSFVRAVTGAIGEAADAAVAWEDDDLKASAKEAVARQKVMAERVARFQTRLVESVVTSTLRASKLQLDVRNGSHGGRRGKGDQGAEGELVVLSSDVRDSVNQIATGELGHGFFEATAELQGLYSGPARPMAMHDVVQMLQAVGQRFQDQLAHDALSGNYGSGPASYSRVSEPRNSYMLHLKPDVTAAIQKAYDHVCAEMRFHGGYVRQVSMWELVEGKDFGMCARFAELVGLMLQNTRMRSGSFAAYVGQAQLVANGHTIRMQLRKVVDTVLHYVSTVRRPNFMEAHGRTLYFGGDIIPQDSSAGNKGKASKVSPPTPPTLPNQPPDASSLVGPSDALHGTPRQDPQQGAPLSHPDLKSFDVVDVTDFEKHMHKIPIYQSAYNTLLMASRTASSASDVSSAAALPRHMHLHMPGCGQPVHKHVLLKAFATIGPPGNRRRYPPINFEELVAKVRSKTATEYEKKLLTNAINLVNKEVKKREAKAQAAGRASASADSGAAPARAPAPATASTPTLDAGGDTRAGLQQVTAAGTCDTVLPELSVVREQIATMGISEGEAEAQAEAALAEATEQPNEYVEGAMVATVEDEQKQNAAKVGISAMLFMHNETSGRNLKLRWKAKYILEAECYGTRLCEIARFAGKGIGIVATLLAFYLFGLYFPFRQSRLQQPVENNTSSSVKCVFDLEKARQATGIDYYQALRQYQPRISMALVTYYNMAVAANERANPKAKVTQRAIQIGMRLHAALHINRIPLCASMAPEDAWTHTCIRIYGLFCTFALPCPSSPSSSPPRLPSPTVPLAPTPPPVLLLPKPSPKSLLPAADPGASPPLPPPTGSLILQDFSNSKSSTAVIAPRQLQSVETHAARMIGKLMNAAAGKTRPKADAAVSPYAIMLRRGLGADACSRLKQEHSDDYFHENNTVRIAWNALLEEQRQRARTEIVYDESVRGQRGATRPVFEQEHALIDAEQVDAAPVTYMLCILHTADQDFNILDKQFLGDLAGEAPFDRRTEAVLLATELTSNAMQAVPFNSSQCPTASGGNATVTQIKQATDCRIAVSNFYPQNVAENGFFLQSMQVLIDRWNRQPYTLQREVFFGKGANSYGAAAQKEALNAIKTAIRNFAQESLRYNIMDYKRFRQLLDNEVAEQAYELAYGVDSPVDTPRNNTGLFEQLLSYVMSDNTELDLPQGGIVPRTKMMPQELHERMARLAVLIYSAMMQMQVNYTKSTAV